MGLTGKKEREQRGEPIDNWRNAKFEKTARVGEEVAVNFRMRDYRATPKKMNLPARCEKGVEEMTGKVNFRIKEIGQVDKIGDFVSKEGMTYYYVVFEVKGDSNNPKGENVEPAKIGQRGLDWAPQLVMIKNGEERCQGGYNNEFARERGIEIKEGGWREEEWLTQTATWYEERGGLTILAIKYIDKQGKAKYIKVSNEEDD